jgi:hypothetical protein
MSAQFPCPSCGFLVFAEPPGSYDICRVCGWEDDGVQLEAPGYTGGANGVSLYRYQREIALVRAPVRVQVLGGCRRDPSWRPLGEDEASPELPATRLDYEDPRVYYWRRSPSAV